MSDLLGIIVPLRKLLSNTTESINVPLDGQEKEVLSLSAARIYYIPDFQREIRWGTENVAQLIDDIESGPKYLGNVIFTQHPTNSFSIIDGQQRITILTMIFSCIKKLHGEHIDVIDPCRLEVESFSLFSTLITDAFPLEKLEEKDIIDSDKLHQRRKYYDLWEFIYSHPSVTNQYKAKRILDNLGNSTVNIILNKSAGINEGIRYFIDVNLKGKQLDTEDIFKSYLFKNDQSEEVRAQWYKFKENTTNASEHRMGYPLLKFLEHYFYCDLYKESQYKGLEFGEDFLLKKEFKMRDPNPHTFREGIHLIELIDDKQYMLHSLCRLNEAIEIMLEIIQSASTTSKFEAYFSCVKSDGSADKMDPSELKVIHNIMGKILKDAKNLPKALIMKYILSILLDKAPKLKIEYQKIYGVYLLSVLFVIFENKKSKDLLLGVLEADDASWYAELITQIESYFSPEKITDTRLLAQYKFAMNEEEEDYRFRCKSIATIYNFFQISNSTVKIRKGALPHLYKFIIDDEQFSLEHFIISENDARTEKVVLDGEVLDYEYDYSFYKKHVNSLFNFVFLPRLLNSDLKNFWIPHKLTLVNVNQLECEYSHMYLEKVAQLSGQVAGTPKSKETCKDDLDLFYARDYKEQYVEFARNILKEVIERIKS